MAIPITMGGVDTSPNAGVLSSINTAANIEARAAQDNGLLGVAGQLDDWANQEMKAARQMKLEERKAAREDARTKDEREYKRSEEERKRGLLMDESTPEGQKFELDKRAKEAEIKAKEAQADKYKTEARKLKKKDEEKSPYTINGKPLSIKQAKLLFQDYKLQDPEQLEMEKAKALNAVAENLKRKGMDSTNFWTSDSDVRDFIELYMVSPEAAKEEDPAAFKAVEESLRGKGAYKGFQDFLNRNYGNNQQATPKRQSGNWATTRSGVKYRIKQ